MVFFRYANETVEKCHKVSSPVVLVVKPIIMYSYIYNDWLYCRYSRDSLKEPALRQSHTQFVWLTASFRLAAGFIITSQPSQAKNPVVRVELNKSLIQLYVILLNCLSQSQSAEWSHPSNLNQVCSSILPRLRLLPIRRPLSCFTFANFGHSLDF